MRRSSGLGIGSEGRKKKTSKGTEHWILLPVWTARTHGGELRVRDSVLQLWTVGTFGKVVL